MKRLFAILLCLLTLLCLSPLAAAEDGLTVQISGSSGAYVVDNAGLLSASEEAALTELAESLSRRQQCDVVILTESGTGGKSPMDYADDYFDYNGYGYGADRSGILLLLSMAERDYWISTRGSAIQAFTDDGLEYLWSKCSAYFGDDDYYRGFRAYLNTADTMLSAYNGTLSESALSDYQQDFDRFLGKKGRPDLGFTILLSLAIGFLIALIFSASLKGQLKSVRMRYDAAGYKRPDSMHLERNRDIYLYANTTSRVIETRRSGGGGGHSSTHISSSGATHGGHGGKF